MITAKEHSEIWDAAYKAGRTSRADHEGVSKNLADENIRLREALETIADWNNTTAADFAREALEKK